MWALRALMSAWYMYILILIVVVVVVVRPSPWSMTVRTTFWYSRNRWRCSIPFTSIAFRTILALRCCCFHMLTVGQRSVEVDPKVSQMSCSFNHSSIKSDCWHRFAWCSFVKSAPQCMCLVWIDYTSGVITPLGYAIELLSYATALAAPRGNFFKTSLGFYLNLW